MSSDKVTATHLARRAIIYVRQSTPEQVATNIQSQRRQFGLVDRAVELGWQMDDVSVIDDDQAVSGSGLARSGFDRLVADGGLGRVGLVLGIAVSRLLCRWCVTAFLRSVRKCMCQSHTKLKLFAGINRGGISRPVAG